MFRTLVCISLGFLTTAGCQGLGSSRSTVSATDQIILSQADRALHDSEDLQQVEILTSLPAPGTGSASNRPQAAPVQPTSFTQAERLVAAPMEVPGPAEVIAPPHGAARLLTLEDLEKMALSQNPAIDEVAARIQAARGNYVQVGLPPNPTAGYTAGEIGDEGTAGQQGAFVSQQFMRGNKLGLNQEAAAWEIRQAEQNLAALRQRVLTDVRTSYYELLIAQESLRLTERLSQTSQQLVSTVEALRQAREASQTDLLQAQVEADTAEMLVANAHATRTGAWQRLATVLGQPAMPVTDVAGDPSADLPTIEFEAAAQRILAESPILAAQYSEIEQARWTLRRARAEVVPDVTVQSSVQHDSAGDQTIAGVQVEMPIPIWNRNQGGILRAQGELIAAEHAANRLELSLQKQFASVYQQYQTSRQQVERYSQEILPKVDETLELTREGYRAGEFDFLRLLTAQRTYFQTNLSYLESLNQMWRSSRQIEGLLLNDSLEGNSAQR